MQKLWRLFSFIILATLSQTASVQSAIVRGETADPKVNKSSIYIFNSATQRSCSGVLIHERVVVTAGHCVIGVDPEKLSFSAEAKADWNEKLPIQALIKRDDYEGATKGVQASGKSSSDIGMILFTESVLDKLKMSKEDLPHLVIDRATILKEMSRKAPFLLIGYGFGVDGTGENEKETLRRKLVSSATFDFAKSLIVTKSLERRKTACFGDSGGGLFIAGSDRSKFNALVGVTTSIAAGGRLAEKFERARAKIREKNAKDGKPNEAVVLSAANMTGICGDSDTFTHVTALSDHMCWMEESTGLDLTNNNSICKQSGETK